MPAPPSPRPEPTIGREELRRRREKKIAELLAAATRAFERDDKFEQAQELLDEATLLNPDDSRVVALWKRLDAERPERVKALLEEARRHLTARSLAAAAGCADRAVELQPDSRAARELSNAVRARLNAASRRAQAGWRIAAGVVVGVGSLAAALLALLPDVAPQAETAELVPVTDNQTEIGGELESEEAADAPPGASPPAVQVGTGRVAGNLLSDVAGGAFPEERPAEPDPGALPPVAPPPAFRASLPALPRAPEAPAAAPSPAAPLVVVRLCNNESACGALRVRVEPAATILFNGVEVGNGAQAMLRLPSGRHQIRLRSDEHEFRRMLTIVRGAPATLEVDLPDEGLPLLAQ